MCVFVHTRQFTLLTGMRRECVEQHPPAAYWHSLGPKLSLSCLVFCAGALRLLCTLHYGAPRGVCSQDAGLFMRLQPHSQPVVVLCLCVAGHLDAAWLRATAAGEPQQLESHSRAQPSRAEESTTQQNMAHTYTDNITTWHTFSHRCVRVWRCTCWAILSTAGTWTCCR